MERLGSCGTHVDGDGQTRVELKDGCQRVAETNVLLVGLNLPFCCWLCSKAPASDHNIIKSLRKHDCGNVCAV